MNNDNSETRNDVFSLKNEVTQMNVTINQIEDSLNLIDSNNQIDQELTEKNFFESYGFSKSELQVCEKVLSKLLVNKDIFKESKDFKAIRTIGLKLFTILNEKCYGGLTPQEYSKQNYLMKEKNRKTASQKAADKKWINSSKMRKERIDNLTKLCLDAPDIPVIEEEKFLSETTLKDQIQKETKEKNLNFLRSCYICKSKFFELHFFYDNLCPSCASLAYEKRIQTVDLTNRTAIVTGGRIKIGYEITLKLLRSGATVIMTTRFPHDAALKLQNEEDFSAWKHRIHIYGLDFRDLQSVEEFVATMYQNFQSLDILINNAAQSVRKPPAFYAHLMEKEIMPISNLPQELYPLLKMYSDSHSRQIQTIKEYNDEIKEAVIPISSNVTNRNPINKSALLSQIPLMEGDDKYDTHSFPEGRFDIHHQQLDLRKSNSWLMKLEDVPTIELLETTAINAISPFILCGKLKNLMLKSQFDGRYIVNVSAMEGKFYRHKTPNHPHTNMAKAGLNMVVRTSAEDYAKDNIFLNAVDTGWVTDENPYDKATNHTKITNFMAPLDEIEGASRVLDPIISGIKKGERIYGKFLKNYFETEW